MTKEAFRSYLSKYYNLADSHYFNVILISISEYQQYAIDVTSRLLKEYGRIYVFDYSPDIIKNTIFYIDKETTIFVEKESNTPTNQLLAKRLIDAFKSNSVKFIESL